MKLSILRTRDGKSVVEVLIWLAMAGFLVPLVLPANGRFGQDEDQRTDRRNARTLVSVWETAWKSGVFLEGDSKQEVLDRVVSGTWATHGAFAGTFFGVPEMSEAEKLGASVYLSYEHGMLKYQGETRP